MTTEKTTPEVKIDEKVLDVMFKAGAHYGYSRSRRHPTAKPYIYGSKNKTEIIDLEGTYTLLQTVKEYVKSLGEQGKTILFVGGKKEAHAVISLGATEAGMPYVDGRWVGGTLTNFSEIKGRVDKMEDLISKREKGELTKYTKKERLLIDRQIDNLESLFAGLRTLRSKPAALFVIDSKREHIAVAEAKKEGTPVIALVGTDCDLKEVDFPIIANDSSMTSIEFFVKEIVSAYKEGLASATAAKAK